MIYALLFCMTVASTPSSTFWFVSPPLDPASTPSLAIVGPPALDTIYSPLRVLASPPDAMASAGTAVWVLPAGTGRPIQDPSFASGDLGHWTRSMDCRASRRLGSLARVAG